MMKCETDVMYHMMKCEITLCRYYSLYNCYS